jgi:hypothetical protein
VIDDGGYGMIVEGSARWARSKREATVQHKHRLAFRQLRRAASRNSSGLIRINFPGLDVAEETKMLGTILIIILILLLIGALPTWGYSSGWGYYPGGTLGIILIIVIILTLMGRI